MRRSLRRTFFRPENFDITILKSLVIPAIWLAVRSVIYSQIKLFFLALNHVRIFTFSRSCHFYSKSHNFRSVLQHFYFMNKMRCKNLFLFSLFKPATRSNEYWYWMNSAISKGLLQWKRRICTSCRAILIWYICDSKSNLRWALVRF